MIRKTNQIKTLEELPKSLPTVQITVPEKVYITLMEMRTRKYTLSVVEGDYVKIGQIIGERDGGYFTQPIFSTVSGTVGKVIKKFTYTGKKTECLEIINDFKEEYAERVLERTDEAISKLSKAEIIEIIKENGVKGLGGGGFPSYVKMDTDKPIDVIILNGVECEPYLTADYQAITKDAYQMFKGLEYVMQAMGTKRGIIGVKRTKHALLKALTEVKESDFKDLNCDIIPVSNYYPQGWEIELIKNTTGIKVKPGTLLSEYGIIEYNVTTAAAIYQAIKFNLPVLNRYFTVTGDAINNPCEMTVRVGTPIPHIVEAAGGYSIDGDKVMVLGGPMMGSNLMMDDAIVSITVSSLLLFKPQEYKEEPCVRCGSCVYSCPANLQPVQLMYAAKTKDGDAAKALNIQNCIECGLCSYVCTSKIHLTDFMRKAKKLVK
ncbi:RnfABCDGE type electron transport complex subunit C [Mycoplasmatota bacterium]|nr:RnfABCDGE type electron transport complex subunit C [Mycoplasmatota bacterium]